MKSEFTQQKLETLLSPKDIGNTVYPTGLFKARLREEFLRTNRTQRQFLYFKIVTRQFDLIGFGKTDSGFIRAWKIAVLSVLTETKFTDVVGYLDETDGLGVIFLDSGMPVLERLRRKILHNINKAGLISVLRKKTKQPVFQVSIYTGLQEKKDQQLDSSIEKFNTRNGDFFTLSRLFYSDILFQANKITTRYKAIFKRAFDIASSFCGIVILSPLLITCAIIVKVSDPKGPVIFKQVRVGKNGSLFTMYKFRSMYINAEERKKELQKYNESNGPTFKMKNDPRVYPMGRILRKFSLDELPQLFNILFGSMSVVGPRPPLPKEVEEYYPWHKMRLSVTPGLTCFWQVSGRSDIGFEDQMRLDNKYVRHGNFGTDIQLVAQTFKVVFKGDGAY
ncbi:MAG: sugar transferase [Fibrobacteraceae bacterium]|nr:sugar transferase [Fibrobacteraceae bacterium]